jgi:hypothetical protein
MSRNQARVLMPRCFRRGFLARECGSKRWKALRQERTCAMISKGGLTDLPTILICLEFLAYVVRVRKDLEIVFLANMSADSVGIREMSLFCAEVTHVRRRHKNSSAFL